MDTATEAQDSNGKVPTRRYLAIEEHLYSDLKEEAVILNLANGKYYGLNAVGVAIWKRLSQPASMGDIESAIVNEFEVDRDTCRREATLFLEKMLEEKLVILIDE